MPKPQKTMAEWERSQEGDPAAQASADNIQNTFFSEALLLRYGAPPSHLDWAALALLGRQALAVSRLYWGPGAETEPDHLHLRCKVLEQLRAVEERLAVPVAPASSDSTAAQLDVFAMAVSRLISKGES